MGHVKTADKPGTSINMDVKRLMVAGIPFKNVPARLPTTHDQYVTYMLHLSSMLSPRKFCPEEVKMRIIS